MPRLSISKVMVALVIVESVLLLYCVDRLNQAFQECADSILNEMSAESNLTEEWIKGGIRAEKGGPKNTE